MFPSQVQSVDQAVLSAFGVSVSYSRPGDPQSNPVAAFPLTVVLDTSGEFADPESKFYAGLSFQTASVPSGPQRGDLILFNGKTYEIKEVGGDPGESGIPSSSVGWSRVKVRWTGR